MAVLFKQVAGLPGRREWHKTANLAELGCPTCTHVGTISVSHVRSTDGYVGRVVCSKCHVGCLVKLDGWGMAPTKSKPPAEPTMDDLPTARPMSEYDAEVITKTTDRQAAQKALKLREQHPDDCTTWGFQLHALPEQDDHARYAARLLAPEMVYLRRAPEFEHIIFSPPGAIYELNQHMAGRREGYLYLAWERQDHEWSFKIRMKLSLDRPDMVIYNDVYIDAARGIVEAEVTIRSGIEYILARVGFYPAPDFDLNERPYTQRPPAPPPDVPSGQKARPTPPQPPADLTPIANRLPSFRHAIGTGLLPVVDWLTQLVLKMVEKSPTPVDKD